MSDRIVQSHRGCDGRAEQFKSGVGIASDVSRPAKRFQKYDTRPSEIMNASLTIKSKNLRKESLGNPPIPTAHLGERSGTICVSKNDQGTNHMNTLRSHIGPNFQYSTNALRPSVSYFPPVCAVTSHTTDTSASGCLFQPGGVSQNPAERLKSHIVRADGSFAVSRPQEPVLTAAASHLVPALMRKQEEIKQLLSILTSNQHLPNTNRTNLEQEHTNTHKHSAFVIPEREVCNCSNCGKFTTPYATQNNTTMLRSVPSTSNHHSPVLGGEQYQRNSVRLFPSQSTPPERITSELFHHAHSSLQRMPQSVHDVEPTGVCTSVDAVGGLAEAPPIFSQTTQSLLITKKTDVNSCEESQIFKESTVCTRLDVNTFSGLDSRSPIFGHGQPGVKLQLLGSSSDNEGEENAQDVEASEVPKNESSAETDTMDMGSLKEKNNLSGEKSSSSNKVIIVDTNLLPQATIPSAGEDVGCSRPKTGLPDMNLEPPSMDNEEASPSTTQSLDMELLVHAEQPSNSKSNHFQDGLLGPNPSSRWIKRLKPIASNSFALGTKSSDLGEALSHKSANQFSSPIMEASISSSEPRPSKRPGKEVMGVDQTTTLPKSGDSSSVDSAKKGGDLTLSHFWVQRWRPNRAATPQKKAEVVVGCEPQRSKLASEDGQKKKYPSAAAMALMGKALNGTRPCRIRKGGSLVVWKHLA